MNTVLVTQALQKVPSANVLINLVSQRVRQLNFGVGGTRRPLVAGLDHLSSADLALHEIIEGKMGLTMPEFIPLERPTQRGRARPHGWARIL
jgi:DNA-directed RNA polymerase subunit omega